MHLELLYHLEQGVHIAAESKVGAGLTTGDRRVVVEPVA